MGAEIKVILAERLAQMNITRYRIAQLSGVSYPNIDAYYKDRISRFNKETLLRICLALDCQPGDIIRLVETEDSIKDGA